jgi:hypothetical protein
VDGDVPIVSFTLALLFSTVSIVSLGFLIASVVPTARFAQPISTLIHSRVGPGVSVGVMGARITTNSQTWRPMGTELRSRRGNAGAKMVGNRFGGPTMIKATVLRLAMSIPMASSAAIGVLPRLTAMQELTVPKARLPAGCALSPAPSVHLDGNTIRGGLWAGLPIATNPWAGSDASLMASLREHLDPPLLPDGPPLSRGESARYRLRLADDIEEAYAAIYLQSESSPLVVVYGLRFASAEMALEFWGHARASRNPRAVGIAIGPIVAVIEGDGGQCFQAVGAYVKSLTN